MSPLCLSQNTDIVFQNASDRALLYQCFALVKHTVAVKHLHQNILLRPCALLAIGLSHCHTVAMSFRALTDKQEHLENHLDYMILHHVYNTDTLYMYVYRSIC